MVAAGPSVWMGDRCYATGAGGFLIDQIADHSSVYEDLAARRSHLCPRHAPRVRMSEQEPAVRIPGDDSVPGGGSACVELPATSCLAPSPVLGR
jgi:hypothetical protein